MIFQNSTDLLISAAESAKMQRDAGIEDPVFKNHTGWLIYIDSIQICNLLPDRTFPIGVVEGKPVFVGDELWYDGKLTHIDSVVVSLDNIPKWSWNPPKPKTVMVELLREDAESLNYMWRTGSYGDSANRIVQACKVALEK